MDGWTGVVIMVALGAGFAGVMIGLSLLLGPRNPTPEKLAPYECGMPAVGDARERHSVKFYLVAMIFIVFDVEVVFLYPWAVSYMEFLQSGVGFYALGVAVLFIVILAIGLLYDIKKGGLEFDETRRPVQTLSERFAIPETPTQMSIEPHADVLE